MDPNKVKRDEGLEIQLNLLLEMQEAADVDETIYICTTCYNSKQDCICPNQCFWPIHHVIARLRWMLGHS
jgi:hypothetical protein